MQTVILLFQCADQKGIVARISDFIFQQDGNIITADQYSTDPMNGHFFLRIEFYIDEAVHSLETLSRAFEPLAKEFQAKWQFYAKDKKLRMGILVSKPDHCLFDLLYLWKSGDLNVDIPCVVSNHPDHKILVEQYGVQYHYVPDVSEKKILNLISDTTDFLVLARYMQVLSADFLAQYGKDMINIHHSFLPSFKGANPYKQAFEKGVKVIGATSHFVTEDLDSGAIISQMVEPVSHKDDVASLIRKGKNLEKRALSHAIHNYLDYRIMRFQDKTIVF